MKLLIVCVIIIFLSGCSALQDKMDSMSGLSCTPPVVHSVCEPNESLLICNSADKKDCYGWIE